MGNPSLLMLTVLVIFKVAASCDPPCLNQGTCSFNTCVCPDGQFGVQCEFTYRSIIWSPWSACDVTCGGGGQRRRGIVSINGWWWPNQYNYTDTQICGNTCVYGSFVNNTCVCPPGYKGSCCEVAPICHTPCQNGGTCVGDDMCRCPDGFYGLQCEIGSKEIPERLKPQFNTNTSPNDTFNEISWYDEPSASDFNRICFIKIATNNAPYDVVLTAVSYRDLVNGSTIQYGNYSTGPIDATATLTGQLRFACLQVRCPGWTLDGKSFDVHVDVNVQSRTGQCNLTSHHEIPVTTSPNQISFTLVEGENYGPFYGIYFASGYRERAEYLSRHVCYSGRQYDFASLHPSIGVLATINWS